MTEAKVIRIQNQIAYPELFNGTKKIPGDKSAK